MAKAHTPTGMRVATFEKPETRSISAQGRGAMKENEHAPSWSRKRIVFINACSPGKIGFRTFANKVAKGKLEAGV